MAAILIQYNTEPKMKTVSVSKLEEKVGTFPGFQIAEVCTKWKSGLERRANLATNAIIMNAMEETGKDYLWMDTVLSTVELELMTRAITLTLGFFCRASKKSPTWSKNCK